MVHQPPTAMQATGESVTGGRGGSKLGTVVVHQPPTALQATGESFRGGATCSNM